jgi:SAM-dependent methyltransferase
MRPVPYRMWVAYYLLLLSQQAVRPKRILDVCCGTGTMCQMLHTEGFQMSGFDLSAEMIEEARRKIYAKMLPIRYEVADAAEFEMGETYDAAFSFFDSLNNILDRDRLQMAFGQVWKHLVPGGSWIFDVNTAYAFETKLFDQEDLKASSPLKYHWTGNWDPQTRLIRVDMLFWKNGEEFRETHTQRAYGHLELVEMLEKAGFVDIRPYNSYSLDPPRKKSDRIHYTCRKPAE